MGVVNTNPGKRVRTRADKPIPEGADVNKPLTYLQAAFAQQYIQCFDAKEAARRVGASPNTATVWLDASRFPQVTAEIRRLMAATAEEYKPEGRRVIGEIMAVGLFNPKQMLNQDGTVKGLMDLPDHVAAAVKKMSVTYDTHTGPDGEEVQTTKYTLEFHDKMAALEMLCKHLGLYDERTGVNNAETLQVDWTGLVKSVETKRKTTTLVLEEERKALPAHAGTNGDTLK